MFISDTSFILELTQFWLCSSCSCVIIIYMSPYYLYVYHVLTWMFSDGDMHTRTCYHCTIKKPGTQHAQLLEQWLPKSLCDCMLQSFVCVCARVRVWSQLISVQQFMAYLPILFISLASTIPRIQMSPQAAYTSNWLI